jgi:hypothetical protein
MKSEHLLKQAEAEKKIERIRMGDRIFEPADEAAAAIDLGPLAQLKGKWTSSGKLGWNVISVPGPANPDGFVLEVIPYSEELTFTPVVQAGNRGPFESNGTEDNQSITGLLYQQIIKSECDTPFCAQRGFSAGQEIHAERGLLLFIQNFNSGFDIARLSVIPHGNSLLAMGQSFNTPPANNNFFGTALTAPTTLAGIPIPGYGADQFGHSQFPEFNQNDPNTFLQSTLGEQTIKAMTTLVFSTANEDGGILNIPFITDNVKATQMHGIFWIETIQGLGGNPDFLQLQYTQTINLVFPPTGKTTPVIWPHVTINTLKKIE